MGDHNNCARPGIVQARSDFRIEFIVYLTHPRLIARLVHVEEIVDNDDIGAMTGELPVGGRREDAASACGHEIPRAIAIAGKPRIRHLLEPLRSHNFAYRIGYLFRQRLRIGYNHNAFRAVAR